MPRFKRLDWNGATHHVMARGVSGREIFLDVEDRCSFIDRMAKLVAETGISVMAWALMPNHIHLLVQTGSTPLKTFMHRLLTGHACYFNKRHGRTGHLFQNRYKAILVEAESYLLEVLRYIHKNPLKAGFIENIKDLGAYQWTGHYGIIHAGSYRWQNKKFILSFFSRGKDNGIPGYIGFMAGSPVKGDSDIFENGSFTLGNHGIIENEECKRKPSDDYKINVIGSRKFALNIYEHLKNQKRRDLRNRDIQRDVIMALMEEARNVYGVSKAAISSGSKRLNVSKAREFLSYSLLIEYGLKQIDCSRILGISSQAVRTAADRFSSSNHRMNKMMINEIKD